MKNIFKSINKSNFKKDMYILICSFLFSVFTIVGKSYKKISSGFIIFENTCISLIKLIIFTISIFVILEIAKIIIKKYDSKKIKVKFNKLNKMFNEHPFVFSIVCILLGWAIYIIAFYPAIMTIDAYNQLKQFLGVKNYYSDTVVLISEDMLITNHHPVMHTLIIGGFLKLGRTLLNDNLGLFLGSILQISILSSTLAYTIKYLKNINVRNRYLYILLLIYTFVPSFPFYAMTITKDTIYTALIMLYIIEIHKIISMKKNEKINIKKSIIIVLLMMAICLMRNNGIYVVTLSFLPLIFYSKRNAIRNLISILIVVIAYCTYLNVILPYFNITGGSIREALSMPFQQTARYVKYYENEITEEEKEKIGNVLSYDSIGDMYTPESADLVKGTYRKNCTKTELMEYFKVWTEQFKKHPLVYIESTLANTYGYFYPLNSAIYINYLDINNPILKLQANFWRLEYQKSFMKYSYNGLEGLRNSLAKYALNFQKIPILRLSVITGYNTWIMILSIAFCIAKKKRKNILILLPSIVTLLVCIASPVNNHFRYAMPIIFSNPLIVMILLKNSSKENDL